MTRVLFASNNQNKQREVASILKQTLHNKGWELTFPAQLSFSDSTESLSLLDPAETGSTFQANALLKAKAFLEAADLPNLVCLADDSGIIVPSLGLDFPGVNSKRWHVGSDTDRNQQLLAKLENASDRSAFFTTVLCWLESTTAEPIFFEGKVMGQIAPQPLGQNGFGYDPIFIPDGFTQTMAELSPDQKNSLSHRGRALRALKEWLQ